MVQKIGQITNADLYLNEVDLKGRVAELDMGDFGHQDVEHAALGMIGVLKLPGRPVQAIEGKLTCEWLDEALERELMSPVKNHKLQLHSYVDIFDDTGLNLEKSHTLVTHLGFHTMKRGGNSAKLGEAMGTEHDISITSFVQKVYGQATPIFEFDVHNSIYNVNGIPQWPT